MTIYSKNFDKFYTKPEIAQYCIDIAQKIIPKGDYFFIEPSAGSGSFYDLLPDPKIGIDIEPENEKIIKKDYLSWNPPIIKKQIIVIGNFPFGKRGRLQIQFVNHSNFASYLAFIGSPLFLSEHHRPKEFKIIYRELLPKNSFLYNQKDYDITSYFYIMEKTKEKKKPIEKIRSNLIDCWVCGWNKTHTAGMERIDEADFFLPSAIFVSKSISIYKTLNEVPSHWAYAIKVLDKDNIENIKNIFNLIDWSEYILSTNRTKSLTRNIIEKILIDKCGKKFKFGKLF